MVATLNLLDDLCVEYNSLFLFYKLIFMKKLIFSLALLTTSLITHAQSYTGAQALLFETGYQSNYSRVLLGVQYRYVFYDNFRIAPDAMLFLPKDKTTGLDINVNLHYTFNNVLNIHPLLSAYPLAGLNMSNNRYAGETKLGKKIDSRGYTDWGFNLGGGVGYNFYGGNSFVNLEAKYVFSNTDAFVFSLGYGVRF